MIKPTENKAHVVSNYSAKERHCTQMEKQGYVYIITNHNNTNTTLYIGVTSDLERRMYEHKAKLVDGFSSRYNLMKLVYFETTQSISTAIEREKQLKGWLRVKKVQLVNSVNPQWQDLSDASSNQSQSQRN